MGEVRDIVDAILFLERRPPSSTGETVHVDGGPKAPATE